MKVLVKVLPVQFFKTIKVFMVVFAFLMVWAFMPAPHVRAAALSGVQIQAILNLLSSFGADESVIDAVNTAMGGITPVTNPTITISRVSLPNIYLNYANLPTQTTSVFVNKDTGAQFNALAVQFYEGGTGSKTVLLENWLTMPQGNYFLRAYDWNWNQVIAESNTVYIGSNVVPVTFVATPTTGAAPLAVKFTMKGLNQAGTSTWYAIYFGDTAEPNSSYVTYAIGSDTTTHTYTKPGTFTAHFNKKTGPNEETEIATVRVAVNAPAPAPTCTAASGKSTVYVDQPFTIKWTATNATSMTGLSVKTILNMNSSLTLTVSTAGTKIYNLLFKGPGGSVTCSVTVKVLPLIPGSVPGDPGPSSLDDDANTAAVIYAPDPQNTQDSSTRSVAGKPAMPNFNGRICSQLARTLHRGAIGDDVSNLQEFLRKEGDFKEASSTGYFGPATERALQQWQVREGVVSSGDSETTGFGAAGPKTRAMMLVKCKGLKEQAGSNPVLPQEGDAIIPPPVRPATSTILNPNMPPVCVLRATRSVIMAGEKVVLMWESKNATHTSSATGEQGAVRGTIEVSPTETTMYIKRAYGPGGEAQCTKVIEVRGSTSVAAPKVVTNYPNYPHIDIAPVLSLMGSGVAAVFEGYGSLFNFQD